MFKIKNKKNNREKGQVMLLAVFLIGAGVLAFGSIAGYFMVQRIRASSDITDSTKAILAADAGIDCEAYNFLKGKSIVCNNLVFDNGASASTTIFDAGANKFTKSVGSLKSIKRALLLRLQ